MAQRLAVGKSGHMIESMTGFGRAERLFSPLRIVCRIKTVNHRFLDLKLRLPDACTELEPAFRDHLKERVGRGAVEMMVRLEGGGAGGGAMELDMAVLDTLFDLERRLAKKVGKGRKRRGIISLERLLSWPGVVRERDPSVLPGLCEAVMEVFLEALTRLVASRRAEGEKLAQDLSGRLDVLAGLLATARARLPEAQVAMKARLAQGIADLLQGPVEEGRLAQELAYLYNRSDIHEECARLDAHLSTFQDALQEEGENGRRLDFLCQELNREVNTLCSKSQDPPLTNLGVAMKVEVEKIREQVQNLR